MTGYPIAHMGSQTRQNMDGLDEGLGGHGIFLTQEAFAAKDGCDDGWGNIAVPAETLLGTVDETEAFPVAFFALQSTVELMADVGGGRRSGLESLLRCLEQVAAKKVRGAPSEGCSFEMHNDDGNFVVPTRDFVDRMLAKVWEDGSAV
nr:hypothetical protein Iba_chr10eCG11060 [Ipomoea batatas]